MDCGWPFLAFLGIKFKAISIPLLKKGREEEKRKKKDRD